MNDQQNNQCHAIIHSAALTAGAGNAVPVPGLGLATDTVALTLMATSLAAVFGKSLPESAAKAMAVSALKRAMLQQPVKTIGKELSKFIPWLGMLIAPVVSVAIIEAAGWALANELSRESYFS